MRVLFLGPGDELPCVMGVPEAGLPNRHKPRLCVRPVLLDHERTNAVRDGLQQPLGQNVLPLVPPGGFHFFFRLFSYALRASWSFATNTLSSEWAEGSRRLRSRETALS